MTLSDLKPRDRRVLDVVRDMPLATAGDIRWAVRDRTEKGVFARIASLRDAGLLEPVSLGCLGSRVGRYHLTEQAQEVLGITEASWHQYACLVRELERFIGVEWLYPAGSIVRDLGPFESFEWVDGVSFDATVSYRDGWTVLMWLGLLRSESGIRDKLRALGSDLEALACGVPHPRPARLVLVVPDLWASELALRVAGRYRMSDWTTVWCIGDGSLHGVQRSSESRGRVHQPVYRRTAGRGAWQARVERSLWSEAGNRDPAANLRAVRPVLREAMGNRHEANRLVDKLLREIGKAARPGDAVPLLRQVKDELAAGGRPAAAAILGRVATHLRSPGPSADTARVLMELIQWPGMPTSMAQAVLREGLTGRRAQKTLARLVDLGLASTRRVGRVSRYWPTREGVDQIARLDRTTKEAGWDLIQMDEWVAGQKSEAHEFGLMAFMSQFLAAGCAVAAGWRDHEPQGFSGGIVPDAMVHLRITPFLPGWYYVEYELSATSLKDIADKCRGFDSPYRVNLWPVLVVCAHDAAEARFHEAGREMGIHMLTTTVGRLKAHGPVGNAECWRVPEYISYRTRTAAGGAPILG